jgi:hypothetical protein
MKQTKRMKALQVFLAIVGIGGMIFFTVLPLFSGLGGGTTSSNTGSYSAY